MSDLLAPAGPPVFEVRYAVTRYETLNSVYEVDQTGPRVRRLSGTNDPTPYQGPDGQWKDAQAVTESLGGLTIWWGGTEVTVTSRVVSRTVHVYRRTPPVAQ